MATPPDALLEARGLDIGYGSRLLSRLRRREPVVRDVSFSLAPREVLALVGESGSGKTTVARGVVGLIRPWAGELRFDGAPLRAHRTATQRRDIQMVFQDPRSSLDPRMRVEAIIAEAWTTHPAARPDGTRRDAVLALLDQVGLPEGVARRRPGELSGGQCQRVSIARALALSPRLIVCDEAVSALDVSVQAQILQLLFDLKESHGLSLLFITHDLGVVRQIADRCAVMHGGELVEVGDTESVFRSPRDPYTAELLDAALDIQH
jgi:peptide/nickel transport system ATP-binding protein/oligopeptide transport system ATP-binding protein